MWRYSSPFLLGKGARGLGQLLTADRSLLTSFYPHCLTSPCLYNNHPVEASITDNRHDKKVSRLYRYCRLVLWLTVMLSSVCSAITPENALSEAVRKKQNALIRKASTITAKQRHDVKASHHYVTRSRRRVAAKKVRNSGRMTATRRSYTSKQKPAAEQKAYPSPVAATIWP
jgi:hypothetical protein